MAFLAKTVANKAFEYVKNYLIEELKTKLKEDIDPLFDQITTTLKGNAGLQTILKQICTFKQIDDVKNELIEQTQKDEFYVELKEKIPEITDEMIVKLKKKLQTLINTIITCNTQSAIVEPAVVEPTVVESPATTGGSKQRDRKQKRRQKTKKRIYKKSRGRRQYSRK